MAVDPSGNKITGVLDWIITALPSIALLVASYITTFCVSLSLKNYLIAVLVELIIYIVLRLNWDCVSDRFWSHISDWQS